MKQDCEDVSVYEMSHEKDSIREANDTQFMVIIQMFSFYFKNHLIVSK